MPVVSPQIRRLFSPLILFLPVLAVCLSLFFLLLPGEPLTNYRYAAASSSPPDSLRDLQWQENTTGHSLTRSGGKDMFLVEGTLAPGEALLIPSFFGTVTAGRAGTRFSGSPYFLLTESGSFSLRVHNPFLRTLQPRVLTEDTLQQLVTVNRISMILGAAILIAALFPGPGRATLLLAGIYLLLSGYGNTRNWSLPGWVFTTRLLYYSLCPLTALLAFKRRYRILSRETDTLVSFTMGYGICLIYYHFDEFTQWLLIFGTLLQLANLLTAVQLAWQNRRSYAPAAYAALIMTLTAFLGLWVSLTLGISGSSWLMAAFLPIILTAPLFRLPAPPASRTPAPKSRVRGYTLYFSDFEGSLKKLGFDSQTIRRIAHKCNTSSHHMQHVAEYTRAICIAMGFSAEQTKRISRAALLHDIGKLEIPDAVLFEPGKLTSEAFALIQSHNRLGYDLLIGRDTEFFRLAAEVALQHHERMDGTGYLKLKGEEISLPARIVAVADVFDALTAPRVYKEPWDFESAFKHILENRGIHFDSKVVDDFLKCKSTIRRIYDSYTAHD